MADTGQPEAAVCSRSALDSAIFSREDFIFSSLLQQLLNLRRLLKGTMARLLLIILTVVGLIGVLAGGETMFRRKLVSGDSDAMQHDYPIETRLGGY
ncbi:hypothetical protein [uncultured Methylobacterium sp.]|uniref:hypothetical protein n=1 Tax=uncultured Methylobacterium sp. TaxID=157278 RepID=UPI00259A40B6|nr:hypothetical protein [uncultured Methylobacterium sp.]